MKQKEKMDLSKLGQEVNGMIYVGILLDDNENPYALLVEKEDRGKMTWGDAIKTNALPTIEELNLMRANHKILRMTDWYWSSAEYNNSSGAWIQRFSDGSQTYDAKYNDSLVRCVRRLAL